jgi:hypothetical protein
MAAPEEEAELDKPPSGRRRERIRWLVAGLLLLQLLIPLRYYLGDDEYDERFSWRMFSATRVIECRTVVHETVGDPPRPRPLRLMATIHEAWIETLKRNRVEVIRAFLERRCEEDDVGEVVLVNQCVGPAGEAVPLIEWKRDCESDEVSEPEAPGAGEPSS